MQSSRDRSDRLLPEQGALQHERAPRPLPLFLELVRQASECDPGLARGALRGLQSYAIAKRPPPAPQRPEAARVGPASLRDHGGEGRPLVLIPSLINPPRVLDLDREVSLARALRASGRKLLLLDWGAAGERAGLSVSGHVAELLAPLIGQIGPRPALAGYCLGGTMAIAAANLVECERVATLAAPWHFERYPADARRSIAGIWDQSKEAARMLGALPMEVLQAAFWSIDPDRTVRKFAAFAEADPESPAAARFVALEDWANEGEPVPWPAARELIEDFFERNLTASGGWTIAGRAIGASPGCPLLNLTAARDRIAPAAAAPDGHTVAIASGHVGMIVGRARSATQEALLQFFEQRPNQA